MKQLELRRAGIVPALLLGMTGAALLAGCNKGSDAEVVSGGGSGSDVLATVSGNEITRDQLRNYLEGAQGTQALRNMINQQLLDQSLKTKGITITDKDVDSAVDDYSKELQKRDPTQAKQFETIKQQNGVAYSGVRNAIRAQLVNTKLLTRDVKATDAEIKAWFDKNHTLVYDTPGKIQWGLLGTSSPVRAKTMLAQLHNGSRTFKKLVEEQVKAQDPLARQSFYDNPADPNQLTVPQFKAAMLKLKPNGVTDIITLPLGPGKSAYVILTLLKSIPAKKADFNAMKARVTDDFKMQKLQTSLSSSPMSAMGQTSPLEVKQQEILNGVSHAGNVIIKNQGYAPLADLYKPAPSANGTGANAVTGNSTTGSTPPADNATTGNATG